MSVPIKKNVNKDFFKKWSPEMAYVLGFFFADGSHDINPRGGEYFSFQITDKELIESIRTAMGSNHKIAIRPPRKTGEKTQYRMQIGSKEMCADLRSQGVSIQKTHIAMFPDVPKSFLEAFIRGYFDGDGNVWSGHIHTRRKKQTLTLMTMFTSCSGNFLSGLQLACIELGIGKGSLFERNGAFRLQYSQKDSIILYRIMYKNVRNTDLLLSRKKEVFEKFIREKQLRS